MVSLLIVEDDATTRLLLETAARRTGLFEPIASAIDGQAAIDHLRAGDACQLPGLIISDLIMPRVNGLELVQTVKRDERMRHIPIAVITSSDTPKDRGLVLAAGACSFVAKPYGVEALVRVLTAIRESCVEVTNAASSVKPASITL